MVGTTVIGDTKLGATTLPPDARALNRYFRLLDDPAVIRQALMDVLDKSPASPQIDPIRKLFESTFHHLKHFEHRKDRVFEQKLALGLNLAIEHAFADAADELESLGSPQKTARNEIVATARISDSSTIAGGSAAPNTTSDKTADVASIAMVSEASCSEQEQVTETEQSSEAPRSARAFWSHLLESVHLQVASRTTKVWGRKKIYEVYRLNGPATSHKTFEQVRLDVQRDFSAAYSGTDCRSYALQREDGYLFLHLVIGNAYDYTDERNRSVSGEKKKKKGNEFVFIVKPGSSLMAVTASRAPSKSRFVKYVLTALDLALATTNKNVAQNVVYEPPTRVGDSSGTEPMDLLHAAHAADAGEATGRFAHIASNDAQQDPLSELHQVSTASVVDRTSEQTRLQTSAQHGRNVGQEAAAQSEGAALAMSTETGVVVDHAAADKEERKRQRDETFGEGGPQWKKVRFKWSGTTTAAADSWGVTGDRAIKFKCTMSFHGKNVFEGLREMMELSIIKAPLPGYLIDAPMLGTSTITVQDGAIVTEQQ